jgi:hypothetical protein
MVHWRIVMSHKWWDQDKFEKEFETIPQTRWLWQSKGKAAMKRVPKKDDTFIVQYKGRGVMEGVVHEGFTLDPKSEKHIHSCNKGGSPHSNETEVALLHVLRIIPENKRKKINLGQRTWIVIDD